MASYTVAIEQKVQDPVDGAESVSIFSCGHRHRKYVCAVECEAAFKKSALRSPDDGIVQTTWIEGRP